MDTCRWLVFLLGVQFLLAPSVQAQPKWRRPPPENFTAAHIPSHLRIPNSGLEDARDPEELARQRLQGLLDAKLQNMDAAARQQFSQLLKDPKILDALRNSLSSEDLKRLHTKLHRGDSLADDAALAKLLKGLSGTTLSMEDQQHFRRLAEALRNSTGSPPSPPDPFNPNQPAPVPPASPEPPVAPPGTGQRPSPIESDRSTPFSPAWSRDRLDRLVRGLDRWVDSPSGRNWRDYLRNLAQRYDGRWRPSSYGTGLAERARGLGRYVPRVSRFLWRGTPNLLGWASTDSRLPNLPRVGSLPTAPSRGSLANTGKLIVWSAALTLIAVLLWRSRTYVQQLREGAAGAWQLGAWPVRPDAVTTRGDLVRAFEYLALLCLGPTARTRHHLDLARHIGEQPALDPDRRRDAAQTLARLYEQARYTPDDECLPVTDIEQARRELCYLAGVAAA